MKLPSLKATLQSWLGVPVRLTDGDYWAQWGGSGSFLGSVSVNQALQLATASACVRLISETLATLPLGFYRRNADGSRSPAADNDLYEILHNQPNADMTAVVFWEVVIASMLLWGNAYIEILRNGRKVVGLGFLHPERMLRKPLAGGRYEYRYRETPTAAERVIPEESMMHILAFSTDGVCGLSPVIYGANVLGSARETDRAAAVTFRDASKATGMITVDAVLKPEQRDQIRGHVRKVSESGGVYVLEKGLDYKKLGFDPVSAELLASRSWNVEEIARWFRVDPAMIGHGGKDSNWGTGLEQKMLWFLTFTLRPWCVRIEQAVRKCLLTPVERKTYFAEFNMEGLLRADSATRAAYFATLVNNGLWTRDECRAKDNMPPMGGKAAVLTVQSAMVAIDDMSDGTNASADAQNAPNALSAWLGNGTSKEQ